MSPYAAMQLELAQATGSGFLDAATGLHARRHEDLFLDDCHLTQRGHSVLAQDVATTLRELGWIGP
ncbi:MAG: hypothetical protein GY913_13515 [Proteobacteria bacterium]|nr:hypothetical protein [Pseudomonadota bacterium]MCP4917925.1 hypothetical protein [Pseudomonadota bacterium]